ncbi:helix-turn-helix domain-containing protein [Verrucomicrobiaceae bacterium N1E253]|uniref:Helix-turn-helix domain-containing protein n=1 Tax=Oceaniferula marina TaxID=2748318 RepID=A0A851GCM2_9BACT|nr:helix-turn-helix domain-containing protein [Oceaniferula marina]NWK55488.1 helix-turn-helix domain-containing protein [Oceaniferula marina]
MDYLPGKNDRRYKVGLLARRAFHFYSQDVVAGMSAAKLEPGQVILPVDLLYQSDEDIRRLLTDCDLDGLILGLDRGRYELYRECLPDVPMVNVHPDILANDIPTIAIDPHALAVASVRYFKSLGVSHVANLSTFNTEAQDRVNQTMKELVEAAGGSFTSYSIHVPGLVASYENTRTMPEVAEFESWLENLKRPTGVLSSGGYTAVMLAQSAQRMGINIPDELSILSRSDDSVCLFADPPVSSFRSIGSVVGKMALEFLGSYFTHGQWPETCRALPVPSVIERYSTGVPAGMSRSMHTAVHYIRRNALKGVTVDDVLAACPGLSRSRLYREFEANFGHSPAQEITRLRVDEAKYQLRFTDKSLGEIAEWCSFKGAPQFSTVFAREVGQPPGSWRKS